MKKAFIRKEYLEGLLMQMKRYSFTEEYELIKQRCIAKQMDLRNLNTLIVMKGGRRNLGLAIGDNSWYEEGDLIKYSPYNMKYAGFVRPFTEDEKTYFKMYEC